MKYKNNPRFKPIKKYDKSGNKVTRYIKNERFYTFKVTKMDGSPSGNLAVSARSLEEAKKKAKSWEKNLVARVKKYHGITIPPEKVLLSTGRLE